QAGGDRKPKAGVNKPDGIDISKASEEFAKQNPTAERKHGKHGAWNMHQREKKCRREYCPPCANPSLKPNEENRLQDKFLLQRPDSVLPRPNQRHAIRATDEPQWNSHYSHRSAQDCTSEQRQAEAREWPR